MRLFIAFIVALCLTICPMPSLLMGIKPPWILLFILYIQFYLPDRFNLFTVIILGLILDALLSTVIGEHVLALSLTTWIANSKARRFYFFSIGQQMALIGFFCFLYQLIMVITDTFLGFHINLVLILVNTIISILIWPWLRLIADDVIRNKIKAYRT
ncbi:rod shape-determining protein MreD [Legionella gresilensis]|uniref:rod shape-determining protein MreD n=1 Tax=Legionella gresilensis TaxID=91823 RepID=UPI00104194DF|nr:rod shape-determining protein MreD [Legionella gresilensis]